MHLSTRRPIAAVGVVCMRGEDVLLIRRGAPPLENQWSLPGGRIEWGERARDAALRELKEETGCEAELVGLVDVVDAVLASRAGESEPESEPESAPWGHYVLIDYAALWIAGEPVAGDDAREARFFAPAEIVGLGLWSETLRVIEAARAIVRQGTP
jgi:8-oxo-dGTP diphosphatase